MKQWSKFCQNEEYLEMTRMYTLNKDMLGLVISYIGIKPGMKVLDVGSGSGEYIYYLSQGIKDVEFVGLEYDSDFVDVANRIKDSRLGAGNKASFVEGDARKLPFDSNSFDLVVSHTIFNSIPEYMDVLYEMKRVAKHGAKISTIAAMDCQMLTTCQGVYPKELAWKKRYDELREKLYNAFEQISPMKDYLRGISTKYIPFIFSKAELKNISAYPLAGFVSLSNAAMPAEDKERYIKLEYLSEMKKLDEQLEEINSSGLISMEEITEYRSLSKEKRDYLLSNIGENEIWEWSGFADLLVVGDKPSEGETIMSLFS